MNKKFIRIAALSMLLIMLIGVIPAFAASSYSTYTYTQDGWAVVSPDAYVPERKIEYREMGLDKALKEPTDLETDAEGNVYIADAGNNRIIVLDRYYKVKFVITEFINSNGIPDALKNPNGVYIANGYIYIADTDNRRIIVCDQATGNYVKTFEEPKSDVFGENATYRPIALSVDRAGTMFVVSSSTYNGVISLNADGSFQAFVGAQKVSISPLQIILRYFQTEAQREQAEQFLPTEFNNITMNDLGFIYVTSDAIDEKDQQKATENNTSDYSPVKKLNIGGDDIMRRTGFFGFGEVDIQEPGMTTSTTAPTGPSKVVDVALGPQGTWSIVDAKRSKVFTYDEYGSLLFVFGDTGTQLGNIRLASAITYHDEKILILDKYAANFTIYDRTEYGDILLGAIENQNNRNYEAAEDDWRAILQRNNNFDAAYIGIGKALYRKGDWEGAMDMYMSAYETANYSNAFKMYRKEWVSKYIYIIPIVAIAVILAVTKFFGYAAKLNEKVAISGKKRTFWQEIMYANHLIFHPFDGFWDLKHEKRGSFRGALFYLAFAIVAFTYQSSATAYVFNPMGNYTSIISQIISLTIPLLLWVVANWCFTTLFEGEGSLKDIFIATCYALAPIPLMIIPSVIATNFLTASEGSIITLLESVAWIWVGFLLFIGTMVTHDYSLGKNILMCLCTIVGMVFIMFIALLFTTMLTNVLGFITSIITEISYGM